MGECHYDVTNRLGTIIIHKNGWKKELRRIAWNGSDAKFDIRDWAPDGRLSRGITLTDREMDSFYSSYTSWKRRGNSIEKCLERAPSFILEEDVQVIIYDHIGTLSRHNDWNREVNIVSWNGGEPKIDIREWIYGHTRMTRGLTMTEEDADKICDLYWEYIKVQTTYQLFEAV